MYNQLQSILPDSVLGNISDWDHYLKIDLNQHDLSFKTPDEFVLNQVTTDLGLTANYLGRANNLSSKLLRSVNHSAGLYGQLKLLILPIDSNFYLVTMSCRAEGRSYTGSSGMLVCVYPPLLEQPPLSLCLNSSPIRICFSLALTVCRCVTSRFLMCLVCFVISGLSAEYFVYLEEDKSCFGTRSFRFGTS